MVLLSMTILPNSINISADPAYANTLVNELPLPISTSHLKVKRLNKIKLLKQRKRNIFKGSSKNKYYPQVQRRAKQVPYSKGQQATLPRGKLEG